MAALVSPKVFLFTDPSVIGITSTGDVDDIAAILALAQTHRENLTIFICDDINGLRYQHFMDKYGNDIRATYGCNIFKESYLSIPPGNTLNATMGSIVYIHAPTTHASANWLTTQRAKIIHVFAQGENDTRANFKTSPHMYQTLKSSFPNKSTFYTSASTSFTIPYDPDYAASLNPEAAKLYKDFFFFNKLKAFGLPASNVELADMLFSDTGGPDGGLGNGIKFKMPLIMKLKDTVIPPDEEIGAALGDINTALETSYRSAGGQNESTLRNLRNLLFLTHLYCDYSALLVRKADGIFLPDMGSLPPVMNPDEPRAPLYPPRDGVDPDITALYDPLKTISTPLFDLGSVGYSQGITKDKFPDLLKHVMDQYNADRMKFTGAAARVNGGRKSRRRRNRKRRNTRR